ncbi:MAG: hypothetical protein OXG43_00115 [Chloroflexi bacterium]|nr:hypothetical protein [Chloroflexota bacterium]
MSSFDHKRLHDRIMEIDSAPDSSALFAKWLHAPDHLQLLRENAAESELIIYASGPFTFIHAVVIQEDKAKFLHADDLLDWSGNPFSSSAGYMWDAHGHNVTIHRSSPRLAIGPINDPQQLVFARSFEGLQTNDSTSYEILQEYIHVTEIFWRPEFNSYCRFNEYGDFDHIVSLTPKSDIEEVTLVSFKRDQLEQYLAASESILLRMFDFTLHRRGHFDGWPPGPEEVLSEDDQLAYRRKVDPAKAAYTRGVQIVRPSRSRSRILQSIRDWSLGVSESKCVEFIAFDRRNMRVATISTDPSATTNYFQASNNDLPYETSPVFFHPEVLLRYKADREKYVVDEEYRVIQCRGAWELRAIDVNQAGQVHTYICYLRNLPYREQLYWQRFNEEPKAVISERAFLNDFEGRWDTNVRPLEAVLAVVKRWTTAGVWWWRLGAENLIERVNVPRSGSRDEWARAFSDLSILVIEGFRVGALRTKLAEAGIRHEKQDGRSLVLIEKFLVRNKVLADANRLVGLRTVQAIRSKVYSHFGGREAEDLAVRALKDHGAYSAHFESVCRDVVEELELIEKTLS